MHDLDNANRILRMLLLKVQKPGCFSANLTAGGFGPNRRDEYFVEFIGCPMMMTLENKDGGSIALNLFPGPKDNRQSGYTLETRDLPAKEADLLRTIWFLTTQSAPSHRTQRPLALELIGIMRMHPELVNTPDRATNSLPPIAISATGEVDDDDDEEDESSEDEATATHADD